MTVELSDAWLGIHKFEISKDDGREILGYLLKHQITCKRIKEEE